MTEIKCNIDRLERNKIFDWYKIGVGDMFMWEFNGTTEGPYIKTYDSLDPTKYNSILLLNKRQVTISERDLRQLRLIDSVEISFKW
jgi:hypothetical protein